MWIPSRSGTNEILSVELPDVGGLTADFDRELAAKIGKCIAVRRAFFGLSKEQLGARLGIDAVEMDAYERGAKRMSCMLLLQTAKKLNAAPRFFFR